MTDTVIATPDSAFIPKGTPMFSDLVAQLQVDADLTDTRRRDLISGLRRVARALDRAPTDVPAYGRWLQPRLAKLSPAAMGLTVKAWQNAVSDARAAMAHCGLVERRWSRPGDLSPDWRQLWRAVLASNDRSVQPAIGRFVYFLNHGGVAPAEVSDAHALAYREALTVNEISKSPEVAYRAAVNGWNLATQRIPGWPQVRLTLPSRQKVIRLADEALPASFLADLDALIHRLANPDPLAEDGRARALRPVTLSQYRRQLVRFASELVHSGLPAAEIRDVATLLDPVNAERGLRQMLSRTGNKSVKMISEVAALLRNVSRITGQPEEVQKRLVKLAAKVAVAPQREITAKNRDRLRVLQDGASARRLLIFPERLFNNPPAGKANAFTKALAREDALAIAILLYCPIRIRNLAGIHIEKHLQRPGDGRVFLVLTEDEVKNERPQEFELPRDLVRMIDAHLKTRSPELCPAGTPWLFPRRDSSGAVDSGQLAGRIAKRIRKETGLAMNAHLFRHFAVMTWLDAHPGSYEAARRLLGHSEVSHTINMYSGLEVKTATKAFAELVATNKKGRRA
jgi:integrase